MEDLKTRTRKQSSKEKPSVNTPISCPHDRLFKTAMSDIRVAQDFFEHYLPASIRALADLDSLEICPNSYVDQALALTSSDVLYKATIANETSYLFLLCEHQSSVDHFMPFRVWQYIVAIWRDHIKQTQAKTLPLVVPLVFYHGARPYDGARDIRDLIQAPQALIEEILFKPFHLIDTHHIADETLREQHWAGVMAFVMKHIFARDCMTFIQPLLEMVRSLEQKTGATDYIVALLNYLLEVGNTGQLETLVDTLREGLSDRGDEVMSIAEMLREAGRKAGIQTGIQTGIHTGESNVLVRQLERKFGVIPFIYQKRIQEADSEQLLCWAEKLLEAETLERLFEED